MSITFTAKEEFFTFHDPMQDGKLIDRKTEIRMDPLTGETSRIIFDPGAHLHQQTIQNWQKKQRVKNVHSVPKTYTLSHQNSRMILVEGWQTYSRRSCRFSKPLSLQ